MGTRSMPGARPATDVDDGRAVDRSTAILVVERDPHVRTLLEHFLTEAGYTLEFVRDGHAALERALELRPRIVITEVLVPGLDGLQLCTRLKSEPALKETRVLIFSLLWAREQARAAGADGFVRKPLSEARLVEAIKNLLAEDSELEAEEAQ